jgi:2-dehydro-3-deoxygalactonokinase
MTNAPAQQVIIGDWGTTHLRLYLCEGSRVVAERAGPGIAKVNGNHQQVLFDAIGDWHPQFPAAPILLAGMVGSRSGWIEVNYVDCPADAAALRLALNWFAVNGHRVAIVPGLACVNPLGAPDVMRGEEAQIIGAMSLQRNLRSGRHLLALPGTHCKWAILDEGRVRGLQTSYTGELFAMLSQHSILVSRNDAEVEHDSEFDTESLALGVRRVLGNPSTPLSHLLFETRSRQLRASMSSREARAFLSGLIIGQDVEGAVRLRAQENIESRIPLVGAPGIVNLYALALDIYGVPVSRIDGASAVLHGLRSIVDDIGAAQAEWSSHVKGNA